MTAGVRLRRVLATKPEQWSEHSFQTALARIARYGVIEAREVCISEEHLKLLLQAAPKNEKDPERPELQKVDFGGATFTGGTNFVGVTFAGDVDFDDTIFMGDANFRAATFTGDAHFRDTTFGTCQQDRLTVAQHPTST